jgi:hypothetical protein
VRRQITEMVFQLGEQTVAYVVERSRLVDGPRFLAPSDEVVPPRRSLPNLLGDGQVGWEALEDRRLLSQCDLGRAALLFRTSGYYM